MSWGRAWMGDPGWYEGKGIQAPDQVPSITPVSIGDHAYVADASKYKRSTVPALRPAMDQAPEPGEVSLNNEGLWRRSQSDWRLGAMQLMFDENTSARNRYWAGKGVNPHPDAPANAYQLRLHKDVVSVRASANSNLKLLVAGTRLYVADGTELWWTTALAGGATVWTAAGMSSATGGVSILGVCFDGAYVYAAVGASGIYRTAAGSAVSSRFNAAAHTVNGCSYANGNLFLFSAANLNQANASGQINTDTAATIATLTAATGLAAITSLAVTATAQALTAGQVVTVNSGGHTQTFTTSGVVSAGATSIPVTSTVPTFNFPIGTQVTASFTAATGLLAFPHPNPAFVWQQALSTPHGVFVTGNSGISGEMYRIDVDTSTGSLTPPESMFILPAGEALNDMCYYSGAVVIATSRGVRVAVVQVSFVISATYGPVILIPSGVNAVFGYGEFAWFSWSNYDQISTGMGRLDLARFAADETPAVSSDILAGTSASPVQGSVVSVCNFGGTRCFAISGAGFWSEHATNYVPTAIIDVGRIKFGTTEKKLPLFVDLYHDPLPVGATIQVQVVDEFGTVFRGGVSQAQGSIHPAALLTINDSAPVEQLDLQLVITNGTDLTAPPVLRRWTLYALVTPRRVDRIEVPLLLYRTVKAPQGEGADVFFDTLAEWQYLKGLEASGSPVIYKEGDNVELVYVDQVEMDGDKWDPVDHHWLEGSCTVALVTLGAGS